jgi:N-acetyl-gamma-glutamyl-phosphate reductase
VKAAVCGATGYTGLLLVRLLAGHPEIDEILPVSSSRAGEKLLEIDRGLGASLGAKLGICGGRLLTIEQAVQAAPEVVFGALPHLKSARLLEPFYGQAVVIDLSADFRHQDTDSFRMAYGQAPPREDLLTASVYGLTEWNREAVRGADLIANPGCYPTASLLPLLPLLAAKLIKGDVVINAITGISGAGRAPKEVSHYCRRSENLAAYAPGKSHRHSYEIEEQLKSVAPEARVWFTPHLAPLKQGILVTTAAELADPSRITEIESLYRAAYEDAPFVSLEPHGFPETLAVRGSNRCAIGWHVESDRVLLFSAIDNLVKGASGQAVQNMNVRFGFAEEAGLRVHGDL